jgi:thiamine-phosphate pyrophosphorylase
MPRPFDLSLYLITDEALIGARDLLAVVGAAVDGGASIVQLRAPKAPVRQQIDDARALKALLTPRNIALIINDRVDVALAADADGVHLGQDDMTARDARAVLGPDRIIGLSVGSPAEFAASQEDIAVVDYVGIGPVRATGTKSDAGSAIGVEGFGTVRRLIDKPAVAIGGLTVDLVPALAKAGADGMAVISAILRAEDPRAASREFRSALDR